MIKIRGKVDKSNTYNGFKYFSFNYILVFVFFFSESLHQALFFVHLTTLNGSVSATVWMHRMNFKKTHIHKARWELHKYSGSGTQWNSRCMATYFQSHKSSKLDKRDELKSDIFPRTASHWRTSVRPPTNTYIISVWTLDAVWRIYQKREADGARKREREREREREWKRELSESILSARLNDKMTTV